MTTGFYAPLPPARTGVADYAAALLAALKRLGPVEVNSSRASVCLYHLGNNSLHREIYAKALARPGVVVLHDAVLHHLLLGSLDAASYIEEFVYNYGEWNRELAQELWRNRSRSSVDPRYFEHAMLRRVVESSRATVVHNPAAEESVRKHAPHARIVEIPHLFRKPDLASAAELTRLRQQIGLPPEHFVFGVFGYLRESKRLPAILQAFRKVHQARRGVSLLIAGEFASADLARALEPTLREPGIVRLGFTPESDFWQLAAAVDACISLRYPAAGETSGIAIRLMGIGKPVILSDGLENSRFPETTCLRVSPGTGEKDELVEYMRWLVEFPDAAVEIGRRAQSYIFEHHSLDKVAQAYWHTLHDPQSASHKPQAASHVT